MVDLERCGIYSPDGPQPMDFGSIKEHLSHILTYINLEELIQ